jgi:hypothetical protein
MDMKLEVVVVPVGDVDRARQFYEQLGFRMDIDWVGDPGFRVVQLTPQAQNARSSSATASRPPHRVRSRDCSWSWPTSRRRARSSSPVAPT